MTETDSKAYRYAQSVVKGESPAGKYVKKQCQRFIEIADGKNKKYCIDLKKVAQIEKLLKLLIMPRGLKAGRTIYECTCSYQWLLYISALAVVYRDNPQRRRYETVILEIARKNFKTFTVAVIFILLFFFEPKFSKFYSVAPDGDLSRELKSAIEEIIKASPLVYMRGEEKRFKILRDYIMFLPLENKYTPLNYSTSRMDGKLPNVFLADEVGALPNPYAIEAMRSGQLNILNKLGCIISTKYPTVNNPFEDEVDYAKRVLDDIEDDETVFALLYEPDSNDWMNDDTVLMHSNPVALEIPEIWDDLIKKRQKAIAVPSRRENFVTKHCNIIYQGVGTESFIDINDVQKCRVEHIDWSGRLVYIGVDLAMTNDNCAVVMVSLDDDGNILAYPMAFIPEGRLEEKSRAERVDYRRFVEEMKCIACGDRTVDYSVIEDFVFQIEEKFNVTVEAIGYDRFNALSSAQKWSVKYKTVQVRQHSDTLHPATKLLYEKIENQQFQYEENKLFEINFENAKCVYDTNMNRYITKKKSKGKVDMIMAMLNALYLINVEQIIGASDFVVQVI